MVKSLPGLLIGLLLGCFVMPYTTRANPNLTDRENYQEGIKLHQQGKFKDAYEFYFKDLTQTQKTQEWLKKYHDKYLVQVADSPVSFVDEKKPLNDDAAVKNITGLVPTVPIGFGIKGGINLSNTSVGDNADYNVKSKLGISGFIYFDIKASGFVSIQPEVGVTTKGVKLNFHVPVTGPAGPTVLGYADFTSLETYTYLEFPILLKARIRTRGSVKSTLFIGPTLAFLISARAKTSGTWTGNPIFTGGSYGNRDIASSLQSVDYGIVLGGGLEIKRVLLDLRYDLGFGNINRGSTGSSKRANRSFSIMTGYRIF